MTLDRASSRLILSGWWAIVLLVTCLVSARSEDPITAPSRPVAVPQKFWLSQFSRQQRELAEGRYRVCFFGDSLTAFWTEQGLGSWELDLKPFRPFNAGIAGDRIEHIHFRARESAFGSPVPEVFVVLAGTNNLGKNPSDRPEAVAAGVVALVKTLRVKAPESRVLVLSILPSGAEPDSELRQRIRQTNDRLSVQVPEAGASWLDVHDRFLDEAGRWLPGLTIDGTHLTSRGYDRLAAPVREWLEKTIEPK